MNSHFTVLEPHLKSFPVVDENTLVEAGMRLQSTQANWREIKKLLLEDPDTRENFSKTEWASSEAYPKGARMWRVGAELLPDGYVAIPEALRGRTDLILMVKVVSQLRRGEGYYAVAAKYKQLWDFDRKEPQRADGSWVYSLPFHNVAVGGKGAFFFIIRISGPAEMAEVCVTRINITRGKAHYRVSWLPVWKGSIVGRRVPTIPNPDPRADKKELDLPLQEAFTRYLLGFEMDAYDAVEEEVVHRK